MNEIHLLDENTIDKIAAGEVVERPASVIKELVENAIDAGADAITVEIKEGGISFMRVTDNGQGIAANQLRKAFLRHATSKIQSAEDLFHIVSLGFRGEALSSISSVSMTEVITKTHSSLTGAHMILEGGKETLFEEIGAPNGTTFLIRNLFYNTPARLKFLKQPATEAGYIADLMEHIALSRPDISFKFVNAGQTKFYTSGNGDLKEVIYRIYGREILQNLVPIDHRQDGIIIQGYLGTPKLVRSNRNQEIYFLNGRYVKNTMLYKAIEEGYKEYLMQHKFPFCVLHLTLEDPSKVDVNVHPTKMDIRFIEAPMLYDMVRDAVKNHLSHKEMIPKEAFPSQEKKAPVLSVRPILGPTAESTKVTPSEPEPSVTGPVLKSDPENITVPVFKADPENITVPVSKADPKKQEKQPSGLRAPEPFEVKRKADYKVQEEQMIRQVKEDPAVYVQETLLDEKIITPEKRIHFELIGQVFDTYWLIQYDNNLYIIDQHAAHEKVKYERLMKNYREKKVLTQNLLPPLVVTLTGQEEQIYLEHQDTFRNLGFEVESFGGREYALRAVPVDLYGCNEKQLFLETLDDLAESGHKGTLKVIDEKIASMSCKAAVKGNNRLSRAEANELIDELLTLDNPYNCPHGRPTIISMSKYELEQKFKR